ncbi:MAG TPA: hypothetical protein VKA94_07825, partial [Hyphomicrobiales bacterium]|nr:hypothetical protein [Hyphomicrobiales bacterium]
IAQRTHAAKTQGSIAHIEQAAVFASRLIQSVLPAAPGKTGDSYPLILRAGSFLSTRTRTFLALSCNV